MENEVKKYLDYEDFKIFVKSLSHSQGSYQRLYEHLLWLEENNTKLLEEIKETIKNKKFTDTLEFVFWLEC